MSAEFIRRLEIWEGKPPGEPNLFPDLPVCRFHDLPKTWLGRSLALLRFRRLKLALRFFVINYGLKPIAWIVCGCAINYGLKSVAWFSFGCVIYGLKLVALEGKF